MCITFLSASLHRIRNKPIYHFACSFTRFKAVGRKWKKCEMLENEENKSPEMVHSCNHTASTQNTLSKVRIRKRVFVCSFHFYPWAISCAQRDSWWNCICLDSNSMFRLTVTPLTSCQLLTKRQNNDIESEIVQLLFTQVMQTFAYVYFIPWIRLMLVLTLNLKIERQTQIRKLELLIPN